MKLTRFILPIDSQRLLYNHYLRTFFPVFWSLKAIRPIFRLRALHSKLVKERNIFNMEKNL